MSRIGRKEIILQKGVSVEFGSDNHVVVTGPLGKLERTFEPEISFKQEGEAIHVIRENDVERSKALHGLSRTLLNNMVEGVEKGFKKSLIINGVGYKANKSGNKLVLNIGFSHPVEIFDENGVTTSVKDNTEIIVSGIDKEAVGQFTAKIRDIKRVEPYHAYGIRYIDEVVIRKEGSKTAGKK
ncbi:MAG: 50S ribosomal protein L6 [Bacilli bacterium]